MAVDAVYLLDEKKQIRRVIVWGVYELIHDEASYELDAEISSEYDARPGEFLAFFDVDADLKLFEIETAEKDERRGVTVITATDAAVAELAHRIVPEVRLTGAALEESVEAALEGSGWTKGIRAGTDKKREISAYREKRWKVLRDIAVQYQVRVKPFFAIENGEITGKYVAVTERTNTFRGRLFEGTSGGAQIYVTRSGTPITRMYGIGKATGTEDPPSCVTFANVAWSKANGDPADKPAGQTYIEDADAIALYGEGREDVFQDRYIEDAGELLTATWEELQKRKQPKVSGTATASDMEHIPGYEHMIVRMYDLVWVRTKHGEDVQAVVINVKRNYLRRGLTKISIGEETDDSGLIKKVAKVSSRTESLGRSSSASSNRYIETKQLIQLNADTIQMNARLIEANAEQIDLKASVEEVTDIGTRLSLAEIELDGINAQISLFASQEEVTELSARLSQAEIDIDGANAQILLKASQATVDELGERVDSAEIAIDGANSEITLKADKVYVDSEITTVKSLIAEEIEAAKGEIQNAYLATLSTNELFALEFVFAGDNVSKTTIPVVTGITGGVTSTTDVTFLTTDVGSSYTVEAGTADPVYSEGVQARFVQGPEYTGTLYMPGESKTIVSAGNRFDTALYYGGSEKTVTKQGSRFDTALYYGGSSKTVTKQGTMFGTALYYGGSSKTVTKQGSQNTTPLYKAGSSKTYNLRGSSTDYNLYRTSSVSVKVQGSEYTSTVYTKSGSTYTMVTIPLFREGSSKTYYTRTLYASAGDLYEDGGSTTVTLQGSKYTTTLYNAGSSLTYTAQGSEYTGTLYEPGSSLTYTEQGEEYTGTLYEPGSSLTYTEQGEEYTGTLYEPGGSTTITEQGEMYTGALFTQGTEYSGGLYTNFEPATITIQEITALTA